MVKSGMVVLTERENNDVADVGVYKFDGVKKIGCGRIRFLHQFFDEQYRFFNEQCRFLMSSAIF
jgi:hypothetical protein